MTKIIACNCSSHSPSAAPRFLPVFAYLNHPMGEPLFRGFGKMVVRYSNRRNPVEVVSVLNPFPRVAHSSQPWAGGHIPVGDGLNGCGFKSLRLLHLLPSCMNTLTGYCPKAQGREERATLGQRPKHPTNPNGVLPNILIGVLTIDTLRLIPFLSCIGSLFKKHCKLVPALQAGEESINHHLPGAARCALHPRL